MSASFLDAATERATDLYPDAPIQRELNDCAGVEYEAAADDAALSAALAELHVLHTAAAADALSPAAEGDAYSYLDDVLERAVACGLLSESKCDELTDELASGACTEEALLAAWAPRLHTWETNTIGVVLDLHYLQVAASSFSLQTDWSLPDFEAALVESCGGGRIVARIACDAALDAHADASHGKAGLHARLRAAGYDLVLSPGKGVTKNGVRGQGATDVDVAVAIFEVAGAFAPAPRAQTLALVAGDADFKPALGRVLDARADELRVLVVAERAMMGTKYLEWIEGGAAEFAPLAGLLGALVRPYVRALVPQCLSTPLAGLLRALVPSRLGASVPYCVSTNTWSTQARWRRT